MKKFISIYIPFIGLAVLAASQFNSCKSTEETQAAAVYRCNTVCDKEKRFRKKVVVFDLEKLMQAARTGQSLDPEELETNDQQKTDKNKPERNKKTETVGYDTRLIELEKKYRHNTVIIPGHTEYIIAVSGYCMGASMAGPAMNEPYRVETYAVHNPPEHFHKSRQMLIRSWASEFVYEEMQSTIWNISSRRHHRDFPRSQRQLLHAAGIIGADDLEVTGIEAVMFDVSSYIFGDLIMNTVENYNITETAILNRKSKFKITEEKLDTCYGSFVVAPAKSEGYRRQSLSVYNCTESDQPFVVTDYYLRSQRPDVQSLTLELSRSFCQEFAHRIKKRGYY